MKAFVNFQNPCVLFSIDYTDVPDIFSAIFHAKPLSVHKENATKLVALGLKAIITH